MKHKLFVVDDDAVFCQALDFLFNALDDIDYAIFNKASDFLAQHTSNDQGFLLIDLFMPGIDGIALLEQLQKQHSQLYIIVTSGHADKSIANKVLTLGAREFLPKPFNIINFLDKIRTAKEQSIIPLQKD